MFVVYYSCECLLEVQYKVKAEGLLYAHYKSKGILLMFLGIKANCDSLTKCVTSMCPQNYTRFFPHQDPSVFHRQVNGNVEKRSHNLKK